MSNQKENKDIELLKYIKLLASHVTRDNGLNSINNGNINQNYRKDVKENIELEARFGTRGFKHISKLDQDNVVRKLLGNGYDSIQKDVSYLRISEEFSKNGRIQTSSMRVLLHGGELIQRYCESDNLKALVDLAGVSFETKKPVFVDGQKYMPINYDEWNFRIALASEVVHNKNEDIISQTVDNWGNARKIFRLVSRSSLVKKDSLFRVDISVVRQNYREKGKPVSTFSFVDSGVSHEPPIYEIEIELIPEALVKYLKNIPEDATENDINAAYLNIVKQFKSISLLVLSGIQESNYPISLKESDAVLDSYMRIIHGKDYKKQKDGKERRIRPSDFIGPSSSTLEIPNIDLETYNNNDKIISIRSGYTVTEKADGIRKMMFIGENGRIYFIDMNMRVQFTGCIVQENISEFAGTLIDGEYIPHNKKGEFINWYAPFDIYFVKGKDVRANLFCDPIPTTKLDMSRMNYRLDTLKNIIENMKISGLNGKNAPLKIQVKNFLVATGEQDIFSCCNIILRNIENNVYPYETDGLIFTPGNFGVGLSMSVNELVNYKITWDMSFKWKPPQFNTIDFLVTVKKDDEGQEIIGTKFQEGKNLENDDPILEYKSVVLNVGYSKKRHGLLNPCQELLDGDYLPEMRGVMDDYRYLQFFPTTPYDTEAGICNIPLVGVQNNGGNSKVMMTEEGEVFGDFTIVEFRYDLTRERGWRWVPLRVRYDKTAEMVATGKQFGNAYHVANSNWRSIHNPVTQEMLRTGLGIENKEYDDVYYNRQKGMGESETKALRDFHNLYVKSLVIESLVSPYKTNILDLAVGKGGDLNKWAKSYCRFVLGIDVSQDNIENRLDGACARYLNMIRQGKDLPPAMFLHGDATRNIMDGEAIISERGKLILAALLGKGPKPNMKDVGPIVYSRYGDLSENGKPNFDLVSMQFAIHYMFEDKLSLHGFMRNVSNCCTLGGHFVSTQFDGRKMFNALRDKKQGESIVIEKNGKIIWSVTKGYDHVDFDDDVSSLGYAIDIYQETINKTFKEYLVNYEYLVQIMSDYGFIPADDVDGVGNLPIIPFSTFYNMMERNNLKGGYGSANMLSEEEKRISFMNVCTIFKKVREVDTDAVYRTALGMSKQEELLLRKREDVADEIVMKEIEEALPLIKPRKTKRKVKLLIVGEYE